MQMSDSHAQKNSLFSAMSRFIGAVNNMDQTVLVPSLLRDVPLDERPPAADGPPILPQDMYGSYVLLKTIRNHMESGVPSADERRRDKAGAGEAEDEDLEKQFHFHLSGLHAVLGKLTRRADTLTSRYQQEIGYRN